jgi:hypothetical protein
MDDRRTRFSLGYFFLAFLVLIVVQTMLARQGTEDIPYSELKERITAGTRGERSNRADVDRCDAGRFGCGGNRDPDLEVDPRPHAGR